MTGPIDSTQFSDEEVRKILEDALETRPTALRATAEGVSLEGLRDVGREVGIDPARIDDAARAIVEGRRSPPKRSGLLPRRVLDVDRTVAGELDPQAAPEVLGAIRRAVGHKGEANEIQGSLEWSSTSEAASRFVTVTSRDGQTTIHASSNLSGLALVTFLPAGLIGTVMSAIGFMQAANAAIAPGMIFFVLLVPTLFVILRTVFGKVARREEEKLEQAVADVALLVKPPGDDQE